jgi:hypothetical protein
VSLHWSLTVRTPNLHSPAQYACVPMRRWVTGHASHDWMSLCNVLQAVFGCRQHIMCMYIYTYIGEVPATFHPQLEQYRRSGVNNQ